VYKVGGVCVSATGWCEEMDLELCIIYRMQRIVEPVGVKR
jgi:hypothetical protein